jgi:hypothetical protein
VKIERGAFSCSWPTATSTRRGRRGGAAGRAAAKGRAPAAVDWAVRRSRSWVRADEVRLRQLVEHLLGYLDRRENATPASVETLARDGRGLRAPARRRPAAGPDARLDYLGAGGRPPTRRR